MRRDPDHFGEDELALLYVAKRLKDAVRLERILTEAGLDYLVEPDTYHGGIIFQSERVGAFFYVAPSNAESARQVLERAGYQPYEAGPGKS
ncbi:MAG TPA: hypothetical protein VFW83_00225 [Bryobacteraceae bacterium]|nr:hypothetical protein [Bryobacteraceae bacterium]